MAEKKKNFFEGLIEGIEDGSHDDESDSPELMNAKATITDMDLSTEDKMALSGWLVGQVLLKPFADLFMEMTDGGD